MGLGFRVLGFRVMGYGFRVMGFRIYKFRAPNDQPFELMACGYGT